MRQLNYQYQKPDTEAVYLQFYDMVVSVAYNVLGVMEDAKDVAQQVFININRALENGKVPMNMKNWVFTIARNESFDFRSNKVKRNTVHYEEYMDLPVTDKSDLDYNILYEEGYKRISKLGEKFLFVYIMYYHDGYNIREISEELEISNNLVRSRLHKIRGVLSEINKSNV